MTDSLATEPLVAEYVDDCTEMGKTESCATVAQPFKPNLISPSPSLVKYVETCTEMDGEVLGEYIEQNWDTVIGSTAAMIYLVREEKRKFENLSRKKRADGSYPTIRGRRSFDAWFGPVTGKSKRTAYYLLETEEQKHKRNEKRRTDGKKREAIPTESADLLVRIADVKKTLADFQREKDNAWAAVGDGETVDFKALEERTDPNLTVWSLVRLVLDEIAPDGHRFSQGDSGKFYLSKKNEDETDETDETEPEPPSPDDKKAKRSEAAKKANATRAAAKPAKLDRRQTARDLAERRNAISRESSSTWTVPQLEEWLGVLKSLRGDGVHHQGEIKYRIKHLEYQIKWTRRQDELDRMENETVPQEEATAKPSPAAATPADSLGECAMCDSEPATVHVKRYDYLSQNYCADCATRIKKDDRKDLLREMSVPSLMGAYLTWSKLPKESKTEEDLDGGTFETASKRLYIETLKKDYLGNSQIYDQATVRALIAKKEAEFDACSGA